MYYNVVQSSIVFKFSNSGGSEVKCLKINVLNRERSYDVVL